MALSEDLRERIGSAYREMKSYRKVSSLFNVSHNTIKKVVLDDYKKDKGKPGPTPKTTRRDERKLKKTTSRMLRNGERVTARKIQNECGLLHLSLRTVQRRLAASNSYGKAKKRIVLWREHKRLRQQIAEEWIVSPPDWNTLIFTDEKRFNSDGPDSWMSWMPKNAPISRNRRQQGGPSLQVWGALLPNAMLIVFQLPQRSDSSGFMQFMQNEALPTIRNIFGDSFVLQQDNAATHCSRYSREKFAELGVQLLPWPSRSPDLNIIENCWSLLSEIIYDGRQFENVKDLWQAIDKAVTYINVEKRDVLFKLYESIPRRLVECVKLGGGLTRY